MANFEVFTQKRAGASEGPTLTIQRRGLFSINQAAFELLEGPRFVELLFSPADQILGIRKVAEGTPHAYMLKGQGSKYRNSFNLSGNAFLNHYEIETPESVRRDAYLDGGILCVNLNDAGTIVTALRKATGSKVDDNDG